MDAQTEQQERTLDFLKIWHNVFAKNLEYAVEGLQPDQRFSVEEVRNDVTCQMGLWLNAQPMMVSELPACQALKASHQIFHRHAADLVALHQQGRASEAQALLKGGFSESSSAVVADIEQLSEALSALGLYPERFPSQAEKPNSIWSDSLKIGIPDVDRQHYAIATLIDQVLCNGQIDCASAEGKRFMGILSRMVLRDIETENEHLMLLQASGVDTTAHIQAHQWIADYLEETAAMVDQGVSVYFEKIGHQLAKWYIEHLIHHDLDLERHVPTAGKQAA